MSKYTDIVKPKQTPQSEPIPGEDMVPNSGGGYAYKLDAWKRLERFLILGSDAPTYYASAKKLTLENASSVLACWVADSVRTAQIIGDISWGGRAVKQDPAIFALALGAVSDKVAARQAAYGAMLRVCRTASHLFQMIAELEKMGRKPGSGRGMRRVIATWYERQATDQLAFQTIKYRERNGFNHKRLIEVAHRGSGGDTIRDALYRWARGKAVTAEHLPKLVRSHITAMGEMGVADLAELIRTERLPWEAIPTEMLNQPGIWDALIPHLGLTALIRNLGNMSAAGALRPLHYAHVAERLCDQENIARSRVHPFTLLQALAVYGSGHGVKGSKTWIPLAPVKGALSEAFYRAFKNVIPTGKRIMLALDVSGSMSAPLMGSPISARDAAAALCLVTAATEPNTHVVAFAGNKPLSRHLSNYGYRGAGISPLDISPQMRLDDVMRVTSGLPFGPTDCALPMAYALEQGLEVDAFVVYTDSETNVGTIHPMQALRLYREKTGIAAKLIVVGLTSTGFTIADPNDGDALDIVGFDSSCPALISDFIGH